MRGTKALFAVVVLTAIVGLASAANAQVQFVGVGSSATFSSRIQRSVFVPHWQRLPSLEPERQEY
jgi:hypothetical protein